MKCKYCTKFTKGEEEEEEEKMNISLFLHFLRFQLLHALFSFAVSPLYPRSSAGRMTPQFCIVILRMRDGVDDGLSA
jgi:hypothetical protein